MFIALFKNKCSEETKHGNRAISIYAIKYVHALLSPPLPLLRLEEDPLYSHLQYFKSEHPNAMESSGEH